MFHAHPEFHSIKKESIGLIEAQGLFILSGRLEEQLCEIENIIKDQKRGYTHPLSGFLFCADCGGKMKLNSIVRNGKVDLNFNCGNHARLGKSYCFSHFIQAKDLEAIVLEDIRDMARRVVLDEEKVREEFLQHNAELAESAIKSAQKELKSKCRRQEELSRLMQVAYEDRVKGKIPEEICIGFIEKYSAEQKTLKAEIEAIEEKVVQTETAKQSVDDFVSNVKKYLDVPELTREMCYELIDRIIIGGHRKHTGKEREIEIVYKVDIASVLRYKSNQ